jgi:4-hydroxybenzoate polyprenyltransferase
MTFDKTAECREFDAPLCVDLDGTLHIGDFFIEALVRRVSADPVFLFGMLGAGLSRAAIKERLHGPDADPAEFLHPRAQVADWLRSEKAKGRRIYLVTAAHRRVADAVARSLPVFAGVYATEDGRNLKGERKRELLVAEFGEGGYDYAGDSTADHPALRSARQKWWVDRVTGRLALVRSEKMPTPKHSWRDFFAALRPHQWTKNLLVLVPLLASGKLAGWPLWQTGLLAVLAWSLVASAGYLLNDILDVAHDRKHPVKQHRPLAGGRVTMSECLVLLAATLAAGLALAFSIGASFAVALAGYFLLSLAYSSFFKKVVVLDILVLAVLYVARVIGGGLAMDIQISSWLLMFVTFAFFGMAALKRQAELVLGKETQGQPKGRGYLASDLPVVSQIALTGMGLAGLVLALYARSPESLLVYRHPERLMVLSLLWLAWSAYLVLWAGRGKIQEDPVKYCLKDRTSLVLLGLGALVYLLAR